MSSTGSPDIPGSRRATGTTSGAGGSSRGSRGPGCSLPAKRTWTGSSRTRRRSHSGGSCAWSGTPSTGGASRRRRDRARGGLARLRAALIGGPAGADKRRDCSLGALPSTATRPVARCARAWARGEDFAMERFALVAACLLLLPACASSKTAAPPPAPPAPPPPAKAPDTVTLDTGETLKGKVVESGAAGVVLEHPVLGRVSLPAGEGKAGAEEGGKPPEPPVAGKSRFQAGRTGALGNTDHTRPLAGAPPSCARAP